MNTINHKFLFIFVRALFIGALCTTIAQAAPTKDQKKLLERAHELVAILGQETSDHDAKIEFIKFEIVDKSECIDKSGATASAFVDVHIKMNHPNKGAKRCWLKLNFDSLHKISPALQTFIIFHELAHVYDKSLSDAGLSGEEDAPVDCYPALKEAIEYCRTKWKSESLVMSSSEWHADWQAAQWMKKYAAEHVTALHRHHQEKKLIQDRVGISSFEYAPAEIVLKWLSE